MCLHNIVNDRNLKMSYLQVMKFGLSDVFLDVSLTDILPEFNRFLLARKRVKSFIVFAIITLF